MEWRCEWCGKPHETNDPPCDNCGHGRFEEAVVQMGPAETGDSTRPVWTCAACGRDHEKHSPPCSRCGNATLEKRERDYSDVEPTDSTGWLDVLDRRYTAGFAVVGVLALVLGLGIVGVVDLPAVGSVGPPSPPDVPGASRSIDGVSLTDAERAVVETVNDDREAEGLGTLDRQETLTAMATYYNTRRVEHDYEDADAPTLSELEPFEPNCRNSIAVLPYSRLYVADLLDESTDATALGRTLARGDGSADSLSERLAADEQRSGIGVDIHAAPEREIFVTVVAC